MKGKKFKLFSTLLTVMLISGVITASAPAKQVTLNWLMGGSGAPRNEENERHARDFERTHPEIKIQIISAPFAQYLQKVQISLAQKTVDLFEVDPTQIPQLIFQDVILPIDEYIEDKDDYLPIVLQVASYEGKIYSWSQMESSQVVFYNVDMMAQIGVEAPVEAENRWTWEELKDVGLKLTKDINGDGATDIWGFVVEQWDRPYQLWPLMQSMEVQAVSDDLLTVSGFINDSKSVQAYQFYSDLYNKWKVSPKTTMPDAFPTGKAAMFLAGPWNLTTFATKYPNFNWSATWHPYFEVPVTPASSWHHAIAKYTEHPNEAAMAANDKMNVRNSVAFYRATHRMPTRKSVIEELGDEFTENLVMKMMWYELNNTAVIRPRTPGYSEYEDIFLGALHDIIMGADVARTLDTAAKKIDQNLKKYRQ